MLPQIFILYNEEQRRIEIVTATSQNMAFRFIAEAESPDEEDADMEHYKKYWKVIAERDSSITGPLISITHELDEAYTIYDVISIRAMEDQ